MIFYSPDTSEISQYINNSYEVSIAQPETISWSIPNQFWSSFKAYCPEYYIVCDAQRHAVSEIQFKGGKPYFLNLSTTSTYNTFFNSETDWVITIVCNSSPVTEKRFLAMMIDSKNKTSSILCPKFDVWQIKTSDNQLSDLPNQCFTFKENMIYAALMRATNLGGTKQTGQQLRGTWAEFTLVREQDLITSYSEFSKAIVYFLTSEFTNK